MIHWPKKTISLKNSWEKKISGNAGHYEHMESKNKKKGGRKRYPGQRHRNALNKIIKGNFPSLKKVMFINAQEAYRTLNRYRPRLQQDHGPTIKGSSSS